MDCVFSRAQAAIEFLMTYGWAVLIILAVIAVLFYLGVLNTGNSAAKSCAFPAGFTCAEFSVDDSGRLYLDLGQATGRTITVTGIGCATGGSAPSLTSVSVVIGNGMHANVTDAAGVQCAGDASNPFKARLVVQYTMAGSPLTRNATGEVEYPASFSGSGGSSGQFTDANGVWVLVPGNSGIGTSDFYVMKYEAKNNGGGSAVSTPGGVPWTTISQVAARAACVAFGSHLLTFEEARTIDVDVSSQASNWMSGSAGTGCMYGGHVQCSSGCNTALNASTDDGQGWWTGSADAHNPAIQNCPFAINNAWGNETRRTYALSNGAVIWDWGGNVWEWMNNTCQRGTGAGYWETSGGLEWTDASLQDYERGKLGPTIGLPWTSSNGIGKYVWGCGADGNGILRGNGWSGSSNAGPFALDLSVGASLSAANIGFRCAR